MMRTTVTMPSDLHDYVRELAHQQRRSMSDVVVELLRRAQRGESSEAAIVENERGFPVVSVGRAVTAEDVRSLDDD